MPYEIGFMIPFGVDRIEDWKEKIESEIKRIEKVIEELGLPYIFEDSIEATRAAQLIKEKLGNTEIIVQVSVEPVRKRKSL